MEEALKITPREGLVMVTKHKKTAMKVDISVVDEEQERSLMTGEIIEGNGKGKTAIFGKYSLLVLMIQGQEYYFVEEKDILGFTNYRENV